MNVKIIDHSQNPIETIYRAFRVCYSKVNPTEIKIPTNTPNCISYETSGEYKMIDFIKSHLNHESPIEHCTFTFAIEGVSRSLLAQITRHRIANFSVQSQRFVDGVNFNYVTSQAIIDAGLEERFAEMNEKIKIYYLELQIRLYEHYKDKLQGMALKEKCNENARAILPNCTTTNIVMTVNLRELRHIFDERTCIHAEAEIRELANLMVEEAKIIIPFVDYKAKKCGVSCNECSERIIGIIEGR